MSDEKTYTERDARDWQRTLAQKDTEIATLRVALTEIEEREMSFRRLWDAEKKETARLRADLHRQERDYLNADSERRALRDAVNAYQPEILALRAALKPFAEFARAYGPVASTLDYPEDHVLLAAPPAGNLTVLRLTDFYAAIDALGDES